MTTGQTRKRKGMKSHEAFLSSPSSALSLKLVPDDDDHRRPRLLVGSQAVWAGLFVNYIYTGWI